MAVYRTLVFAALWLAVPLSALAQVERHELGRRLRAFEDAFEAQADPAARKRAMAPMNRAVQGFFAGKIGLVGQSIDQARHALHSEATPAVEVQWADSLWVKPDRRLVDVTASHLELLVDNFYPMKVSLPAEVMLRVSLIPLTEVQSRDAKPVSTPHLTKMDAVPFSTRLPLQGLPPGDYQLRYEILRKGQTLAEGRSVLSVAEKLDARIKVLAQSVAKTGEAKSTDSTTLQHLHRLLDAMNQGRPQETDYPAAHLLGEAEELARSLQVSKPFYDARQPGEFWLALATPRTPAVVRVMIPPAATKGQPLPLVLALHGAGGSENLFFDGYGNGKIVRLCKERGWLLAAPRSGLGRQSLPDLIDALAKLYPVDTRRVYLVGHSMGAGQALTAVMANPERFAAVAALGGGGRMRAVKGMETVPFFIGIGTQDFAYNSARALRNSLTQAGVQQVTYREYPEIEHLVIVQVALSEVLDFFARARPAP